MNKLYVLDAQNFQTTFGTPDAPILRPDLFIIGQRPDCSQFLVLSFEAYPGLTATTTIPEGFDFTYCQAWGLTINEDPRADGPMVRAVERGGPAWPRGPRLERLERLVGGG